MELLHILSILRKRLLLLVLAAVVGATLGWAVTSREPTYVATSTIYVGSRQIEFDDSSQLNESRNRALDRFVLTFATMIDSETIAQQALQRTGIQRSASSVVEATQPQPVPLTQLLYIHVDDRNPTTAQSLANGLAEAFVEAVQQFEPGDDASGGEGELPALPAYIFESAKLPTVPQPSGAARNMMLGAVLALVATVGATLAFAFLDLRVRTPEDVERRVDLPVLASVPVLAVVSQTGRRP